MPPKRSAFTADQKRALRAYHIEELKLSQHALCQWFKDQF